MMLNALLKNKLSVKLGNKLNVPKRKSVKPKKRLSAPSLMNRLRKKLRRYNVAGKRKPSVKPKKRVSVS